MKNFIKVAPLKTMSASRNPNLGPSQMRARKRRLFFIRFYIILFLLVALVIGSAILSGHEKVRIEESGIAISGNAAVPRDDILSIVKRDIAGRYFYLFSKNNSLIFPRFEIKKDILNEIKTIKDADISWEGWKKISISVLERKPHSVWCGKDMSATSTACYFVDKEGYIYSQAPDFSGSLFVKNYGQLAPDQSVNISQDNPLGSYFLPTNIYLQIYNLIDFLKQNNLKVIYVYFDGLDYRFTLGDGPVIIFNAKNSFNQSFTNFFTAIQTGNLNLEKDAKSINYIDLRYDNKIVVGRKGN
jgi:hypothetical protein